MMPEDLDYNRAVWRKKYSSIMKFRMPELNSFNSNSYNYRYDTLGREETCEAYRSAIFYIQLSPKIANEIVEMAFKATYEYLYNSVSGKYGAYHLLLLNDDEGQLMHEKRPVFDWLSATKLCRDYLEKYSDAHYQFSKVLTQVFPLTDLYSRERYPNHDDLCVIVHDGDGIKFDDNIRTRLIKCSNKLIRIVADKDEDILVEQII